MRLDLNQEDLAQAGGVNRNTQGSYERGVRAPDTSYLMGIASLGVDVVYVLTGKRSVDDGLSIEEAKIIDQYRAITLDDKKAIRRFLKAMIEDPDNETD